MWSCNTETNAALISQLTARRSDGERGSVLRVK